ncbi:MAG: 4Fe-4S dicluster domain-containing protein [Collinsella sp.]
MEFEKSNRVPCTGCGYCMPCPKGINIPGCFAAYNASYAHSWFTGLSQYFTASAVRTSEPKLVSNCVKCGKCARHCPQHIDIPERLDDVRRRFQPVP